MAPACVPRVPLCDKTLCSFFRPQNGLLENSTNNNPRLEEMACILLCFDDAPIKEHARAGRIGTFQISMVEGLYMAQPICCLTYLCPPCMAYWTRLQVLNGDISQYSCCQGYMDGVCCVRSGRCGEKTAPHLCLALESCLCVGPSMSASRMLVMDKFDLRPDPCDFQLIRFSNCVNLLSCVCNVAALVNRNFQHFAHVLNSIADIVFYTALGTMAAQTVHEVRYQQSGGVVYAQGQGQGARGGPLAVAKAEAAAEGEAVGESDGLLSAKKALL